MLRSFLKKCGLPLLMGITISIFSLSAYAQQPVLAAAGQPTSSSYTFNEGNMIANVYIKLGNALVNVQNVPASPSTKAMYQWFKKGAGGAIDTALSIGGQAGGGNLSLTNPTYSGSFFSKPASSKNAGTYYCRVRFYDASIYNGSYTLDAAPGAYLDTTLKSNEVTITINPATAAPTKPVLKFTGSAVNSPVIAPNADQGIAEASTSGIYATGATGVVTAIWHKIGETAYYDNIVDNIFSVMYGTSGGMAILNYTTGINVSNSGYYYCELKNSFGTTLSDTFHITVLPNTLSPTFGTINGVTPPDATTTLYDTMFVGSTQDFLGVNGAKNFSTIQWYKGVPPTGTSLGANSGANSGMYKPAWTTASAGTYYFVLANGTQKTTSNPIQIAVVDGKGITAASPVGNTTLVEAADTLVLSASVTGVKIYQNAFKWYRNGTLLPPTSATIKIRMVSIADAGTYTYKAYNEVDESAISPGVKVTLTREDLPLFHNLEDKYPQATSNVDLRLKGVASETLTNWLIIKADNTTQVVTPYVDGQGKRFLQAAIGTKLAPGKYIVQVSNSDNTLTIQKAVTIE